MRSLLRNYMLLKTLVVSKKATLNTQKGTLVTPSKQTLTTNRVLQFPAKPSCNNRVNVEFLKGTLRSVTLSQCLNDIPEKSNRCK